MRSYNDHRKHVPKSHLVSYHCIRLKQTEPMINGVYMGCSWISQHAFHSEWHRLWFFVHDMGFIGFLIMACVQTISALHGAWRPHKVMGYIGRIIIVPTMIISGAILCNGVRPLDDWIIFASYGASWTMLFVQMMVERSVSWLHWASVCHNLWAIGHLFQKWDGWYCDLFVVLSILPWIHMQWIISPPQTRRCIHIMAGKDILYIGMLGTVFSLTHYPFMTWDCAWIAPALMHAVYIQIIHKTNRMK